jgi:signal transduction histidine kinase/ActR/RegA family two-component response regulator
MHSEPSPPATGACLSCGATSRDLGTGPLAVRALQNAVLDSASFSIIATGADGVIQLFNAGAERMLGYRAADVVNRYRPSDFKAPEEVLARAAALSLEFDTAIEPGFEALAFKASRGIEDIYEITYLCADGSRLSAVESITALRDDAGAIIGYLLIGGPNAVRARVELELSAVMAVADHANRAKSEFLSNMSHELRTPLGAILGFAQLIESSVPPPTAAQTRSVDQILKAGWYLLDLINEILDLALIESGKLSLSIEPLALAEVLRESRAMIEPQARKRGISVVLPQADAVGYVRADRTRVKQVLVNLLSNAVKFNRDGGSVTVTCSAGRAGRVRVSIGDTGAGISAAHQAQLFQPFNRLGREGRGEEGTGIGLVVSKRLVDLMGGAIDVASTEGEGSVFSFELDAAPAPHAPPPAAALHGDRRPVEGTADAGVRTVLYVEDNPANLMLIEDLMMRRPDLRLLSAASGSAGVELAHSARPAVILMDINLPGISGVDALRLLAASPVTAGIPVIALSANASPRDLAKGLEAGFFRYLTKPIKVPEFMATLDTALALGATARTGTPDAVVAEAAP